MSLASTSGTIQFVKRGKMGRTPKFMGAYSPDVTYTCDDYVAPFVLHVIYKVDGDPTSGIKSTDYYIMFGENYAWTGKNEKTTPWEEAAKQNNVADKRWALFAGFSTIAAEIAFIRFGLMAGAVMCQEGDARSGYTYAKMFSQTGQEGGATTTNYEKFKYKLDAWSTNQVWKPTLCLDFLKGTIYQKKGVIGGFYIDGFKLTNEWTETVTDDNGVPQKDANGTTITEDRYNNVLISVKRKDGDFIQEATLGNAIPAFAGFTTAALMSATGSTDDEHVALILEASGSTFKGFGGYANYCIWANGGVKWNMAEGDNWRMPGVLFCGLVNGAGDLVTRWGDGILSSSVKVNIPAAGTYDFSFYIGHMQYFVLAMATYNSTAQPNGAYLVCQYGNKTDHGITIYTADPNRGRQTAYGLQIVIFGRPSVD